MRKLLSGKEIKELLKILPESLQVFTKKDKIEMFDDIYKLNDEAFLIKKDDQFIPHLKAIKDSSKFTCITVDMGAIKFVIKGADIMRPGITHMDDFEKDEYIVIIDENNKTAIAIGQAMLSAEDMRNTDSGKVVKNIHFVGDDYWNA